MHSPRSAIGTILALMLLISLSGCCTPGETTTLAPPLPPGTDPATAPLPQNSVYLFSDRDFQGEVTRLDNVTEVPVEARCDLGNRHIGSIRWNLSPGTVVVLYEESCGLGRQVPLWGTGQMVSTAEWRASKTVRQWVRYNVGGGRGSSPYPLGAVGTTMPRDTIQLYEHCCFCGTVTNFRSVTQFPAATLQTAGAATDKMTAVRWNLPPGVMVVFYEHADGKGRQFVIFGSGEYCSVSPWGFNDRLSRWAWYDLRAGQ